MANPTTVSVWDITDGFVEAIQAFSESLQGTRGEKNWGGAAAREFLNDVFGALPSKPISAEDLARLKGLAVEANFARDDGTNFTITRKQTKAIDNCISAINTYFGAELNLKFTTDPPKNFISDTVADFQTAVSAAKAVYTAPPADLMQKRADYLKSKPVQNDYEQPWDQLSQDVYDVVPALTDQAAWDQEAPRAGDYGEIGK